MKKNVARFAICVAIAVLCVLAGGYGSKNVSAAQAAKRLGYLNAEITELAGKLQNGERHSQASGELLARLAGERLAILETLAETDPAAVLSAKLSDAAISKLPEGSRDKFERSETIEGELEVIAECDETSSRTLYFVNTGKERIRINFASRPTEDLITGKRVRISGTRVGKQFATDQATVDTKTSSVTNDYTQTTALPGTLGQRKVIVILVNFQDKQTQPFTTEQARDVTFSQTSNYFFENSYGQTWLTGDVYGWFTIPMNSSVCDLAQIATYAQQAVMNAGAILSAYDNQIYAFPQNSGCNWTGSGSMGANPGQVWINNSYNINSVAHELGHNFGLYHSASMDCGSVPIGGTCTTNEYGDLYDVMGGGASAHTNAFQKERLGWLNSDSSPPIQTVTSSGTYRIDAYESVGTDPKALKILKSTDPANGQKAWYYVERRTAYGFDAYMASVENMMNGVVIHTGSEASGKDGYALDMTPLTSSWYDPALVAGQTFVDSAANVMIKTVSVDASGAWVEITVGAAPPPSCTHSNPTVTLSPGDSNWLRPGTPFTYTATIKNNDAAGCGVSDFGLLASVPAGWSGAGSTTLNLAPGATTTFNLNISSPLTVSDGKYSVGLVAANASDAAASTSAAATYTAVSGLGVGAASNSFKYTRTQKATIKATITAAGAPVSGAPVTFTLTKPNGVVVTQTATTGTNGVATFVYSFNKRNDPTGLYNVGAFSTYSGFSGKGSTAFNVMK